jgi:16S rRNA processing protein RimM
MDPVRKRRPAEAPRTGARRERVVLARFGAPHGVRGEIRLRSYTEVPGAVTEYSPLEATNGRRISLVAARPAAGASADMLIVRVEGIDDRDAAEALNGIELSVPRDRLPEAAEDDFYRADLVGLAAETSGGAPLGTVVAIHNHGAGDLLEIAGRSAEPLLVPFTRTVVPVVDIAGGRLVVDPPVDIDEDEEETQ